MKFDIVIENENKKSTWVARSKCLRIITFAETARELYINMHIIAEIMKDDLPYTNLIPTTQYLIDEINNKYNQAMELTDEDFLNPIGLALGKTYRYQLEK